MPGIFLRHVRAILRIDRQTRELGLRMPAMEGSSVNTQP
jgi:hypothetical protein